MSEQLIIAALETVGTLLSGIVFIAKVAIGCMVWDALKNKGCKK